MPVLPLVGSINSLPGFSRPRLFGVPNHGGADAALYRIRRVAAFDLGEHAGLRAVGNAIQPHQRSAADAE